MPIEFSVDHQRHCVETAFDGPITYGEIEQRLMHKYEQHVFSYLELIDACTTVLKLTPGDIRQLAGLLRGLTKSKTMDRPAVVVSTDFALGLIHMVGMFIDDIVDLRGFRDLPPARAWLES